jgi:hypothetical protein
MANNQPPHCVARCPAYIKLTSNSLSLPACCSGIGWAMAKALLNNGSAGWKGQIRESQ